MNLPPTLRTLPAQRDGIAMVAVLLVLLALFVLSAPFLLSVRNADRSSAQLADRSEVRLALDSAQRHARGQLGQSHLALDKTPYFDSEEELAVDNLFPEGFLDASDANGVMWDLDVEDLSGRVDLNSASPHVLGNLLGAVGRLTVRVEKDDTEFPLSWSSGFLDQGFVWVDAELVSYGEKSDSGIAQLARGLLATVDEKGEPLPCGPQVASEHSLGAFVVDQRMWALCQWRIAAGDAGFRDYATLDQVLEAQEFAMIETLGDQVLAELETVATVHGGVRSGPRWQRPVRIVGDVRGEPRNGCQLTVSDGRWFNAGTTVRISDGRNTEYAMVRSAGTDSVLLTEPLTYAYEADSAVIQPLARRPVNVNTASPLVLKALFHNLKLRGVSARITSSEANELVQVVVESRPFTGFEDFVRRVVLPAGGFEELPKDAPVVPDIFQKLQALTTTDADGNKSISGFLDPEDAVALYKNARNANDNELAFSTLPLAFASRDVYAFDLRAAVNAESGVARAAAGRELVELVAPQSELLQVWTRQEDFDELPRLSRDAALWATGPEATSRFDPRYGSDWPTRARPHLGPHDTQPVNDPLAEPGEKIYTFPSREDDGWVQLAPSREDELGPRAQRVFHFDAETRDPEGRYLPDGPVVMDPDRDLAWVGASGLQPFTASMWIKPRDLAAGATYLDVGAAGGLTDIDRVRLYLDGTDLVLEVLDGAGDNPDTAFKEISEARYPINEGPGLRADTWSWIEVNVNGNRPDQMTLLVDGRSSADTPGQTRLSGGIGPSSTNIPVDSTDGFPDRCVIRIGHELLEVEKQGAGAFRASHDPARGFGGRFARELFDGVRPNEINQGILRNGGRLGTYAVGSTVSLYGYSLPISTNVPNVSAGLDGPLGPFRVARCIGTVENGSPKMGNQMESIDVAGPGGSAFTVGWGMRGVNESEVEGLVLASADGEDGDDFMATFSDRGGYAAVMGVQTSFTVQAPSGVIGPSNQSSDTAGVRLGGIEIIRYSGKRGNQLLIEGRNAQVPGPAPVVASAQNPNPLVGGPRAFAIEYIDFLSSRNESLAWQVMVMPISIPLRGVGGFGGFPNQPGADFVQITHQDNPGQTEWVRYDGFTPQGQLVRHGSLQAAFEAAHPGLTAVDRQTINRPAGPGSGGGTQGPTVPGGPNRVSAARPMAAPARAQSSAYWEYTLGKPEDDDWFVSRAVGSAFQFRGVMGTFTHGHQGGERVLPVWRVHEKDGEHAGWPGTEDQVMLHSGLPNEPAFPAVVHHAFRPNTGFTKYEWEDGGAPLTAMDGPTPTAPTSFDYPEVAQTEIYVALTAPPAIPVTANQTQGALNLADTRGAARVTLYPSGELPRLVTTVSVGSEVSGRIGVPSALVDELHLGQAQYTIPGSGAQLVVLQDFPDGSQDLRVEQAQRVLSGDDGANPFGRLPQDASLLRLGSEILCYDSYDAGTNTFTVPPQGRGLLGTESDNHAAGASVTVLDSWRVSILAGPLTAASHEIPLTDASGFPEEGTLLIGEELLHYTRNFGSTLLMPRLSAEPGERDRKGDGAFRGRFGTRAASHDQGTPVILFPFRYWDRWSPRCDAPELSYYGFAIHQPNAFWLRSFWGVENPANAGPRLEVLERSDPDVPWDADPELTEGLRLLERGLLNANGNGIGHQSSALEWRVHVVHDLGSFDARDGLSHGWKDTPRVTLFGAEYLAPGLTLGRVER